MAASASAVRCWSSSIAGVGGGGSRRAVADWIGFGVGAGSGFGAGAASAAGCAAGLAGLASAAGAAVFAAARFERPSRCTLPITALRVTPPSSFAIWLALWPSAHIVFSFSTRSSVQDMSFSVCARWRAVSLYSKRQGVRHKATRPGRAYFAASWPSAAGSKS